MGQWLHCFTLTMWDVKIDDFQGHIGIVKSFTLTMWDVKYAYGSMPAFSNTCFTLTMWDVKIYLYELYDHMICVLP